MSDTWTHSVDYSALAVDYARHRNINPAVLDRLVRGLGSRARVLEIGCGTGNYIGAIRAAVGCECVGIDPSAQMLAHLNARQIPVHTILGRAESLDLMSASFDLVFSVDVIHHIADPATAFAESLRVLRPGGCICTVTDSEWVIRNRKPLAEYFPETIEVELTRYPTIDSLLGMLETAGFIDLREDLVEFAYDLTDSAPYRDKVFSSLLHIEDPAFRRGLQRLEEDLARGPVPCTSRYTMVWGRRPSTS